MALYARRRSDHSYGDPQVRDLLASRCAAFMLCSKVVWMSDGGSAYMRDPTEDTRRCGAKWWQVVMVKMLSVGLKGLG